MASYKFSQSKRGNDREIRFDILLVYARRDVIVFYIFWPILNVPASELAG